MQNTLYDGTDQEDLGPDTGKLVILQFPHLQEEFLLFTKTLVQTAVTAAITDTPTLRDLVSRRALSYSSYRDL